MKTLHQTLTDLLPQKQSPCLDPSCGCEYICLRGVGAIQAYPLQPNPNAMFSANQSSTGGAGWYWIIAANITSRLQAY